MTPDAMIAALMAAPKVEWETDAKTGERYVYAPEVCGKFSSS